MWKDMLYLGHSIKRFRFMRKEYENQNMFSLDEVKTIYILMVLKRCFLNISDAAKVLEVDRKTVRKCYLSNRHLYERFDHDDVMFFFFGNEFRDFKTLDESLIKKRGRKNRYSY